MFTVAVSFCQMWRVIFSRLMPKIFWGAAGTESLEAEEILRAGGYDDIVMNRCIKREHTRLIEEA